MAAFRTGDTLVWIIGPLLDANDVAVTGATWTATVARKPDGTAFIPTYAELSNGLYLATVTGNQRGVWALYSTTTVNAVVYRDFGAVTVDDGLAGNVALTTAPVALNGVITLYKRTDYKNAETRSLDWSTTDAATWPDLTGASIAFASKPNGGALADGIRAAGSVIAPSGATKHVRVEVTAAQSFAAASGTHSYQTRATLANGDVITLAAGTLKVLDYIG